MTHNLLGEPAAHGTIVVTTRLKQQQYTLELLKLLLVQQRKHPATPQLQGVTRIDMGSLGTEKDLAVIVGSNKGIGLGVRAVTSQLLL